MTGKQKCKILKEIRRQIAEQNDIRYVIEECTHKGNCRGTCPKCEWEVRMLERELEKRRVSGRKVVLAGISAGFLLTSCSPIDSGEEFASAVVDLLNGDRQGKTATMGDPLPETLEGEPAVPEVEIEEGEVEPVEEAVTEGILPPDDETEICKTTEETEEDIPGVILPIAQEEEEYVLEGDLIYPVLEEGELQ